MTGAAPAGYMASAGLVIGAFYDSLTFCATAIDSARQEGRLGVLPRLLSMQAILAVRLPNWDIAIPAAEEARRLASELGQPIWLSTAETAIAMIEAVRGDPAETDRATARAEQLALPLGANHLVALAQSGPIVAALAHGRDAEALRFAERLFEPGDPAHHLHFACMAIGDLAEAAAHAGHSPAARERLAEVEALVGDAPPEWIAINLRHARAVLADDEREATARFDQALGADLDRWPFWRGRLLLAYGRWLRRRRRVMDSRAPLREARDTFDAIGATRWGDHARAELRASGERSRRRVPEARDRADRAGAPDRAARGRRALQSRDRPAPVPLASHGQHAPVPGVPEARDHVPGRAERCAAYATPRRADVRTRRPESVVI